MFRIGQGYDVHQLGEKRQLILGGVTIPFDRGLIGHSDADVLTHAVMDACLGALALKDIGQWFPDNDQAYKNANSLELLSEILSSEELSAWKLVNLDATIMAQRPKLAPFIPEMRCNYAAIFNSNLNSISVKATTTEKLGFCGREEGMAASAVILLQQK